MRGQQPAQPGDFATQLQYVAVARWLNQVRRGFVRQVIDQGLGDALQRVAPEELDTYRASFEQALERGQVLRPKRLDPQPKVDAGDATMLRGAILEDGRIADGWYRIWHLEHGGHPAGGRGPRRVREIFLVGQPRVARMDVRVDKAWEHQQAVRIDLVVHGLPFGITYMFDRAVTTHHVGPPRPSTGHERAVRDFQTHAKVKFTQWGSLR